MDKQTLAGMIDHTLLRADATKEEINQLCREAQEYGFASVCVNPCYVTRAAGRLRKDPVKVCTVLGFPLGASQTMTKSYEAAMAVCSGADEVDMVMNIGFMKSGLYDDVEQDIDEVAEAVRGHKEGAILKVILETCLLTDEEIIKACEICLNCDVDFVKTSTGFSTGGATVHAVELMKQTVGDKLGIKAAGGIHTTEEALALIAAGATRIGASAGIAIVDGL